MTTPAYLRGRGRGRGRPAIEQTSKIVGSSQQHHPSSRPTTSPITDPEPAASPQEETPDRVSILLSKIIKQYADETQSSELGMTSNYLSRTITDHAASCPVCLDEMGKADPIWSCHGCFSEYHLACIQQWIRGVQALKFYQEADSSGPGEAAPPPAMRQGWSCPSCRREYSAEEAPVRYRCYCGKAEDPVFDPWVLPHSCGEVCRRRLVDPEDQSASCSHVCLLLCHPGPCPPCPQMLQSRCHCGRQGPAPRRCSRRAWSCGAECAGVLQCGVHRCAEPCHAGACPPCRRSSLQPCVCGAECRLQPCDQLEWRCDKVCGRPLACGQHVCQRVCHLGDCGLCPNFSAGGLRSCPCGKTKYEGLSCTEDTQPCGDTCDRLLACGLHRCERPCHTGQCGPCKEQVERPCRCGSRRSLAPCCQDSVLCQARCTRPRSCGRHPCKRRCCDGSCPPCEHPCGRTLSCRNHKCPARCHAGPCYLCGQTAVFKCACGGTELRLPCGAKRAGREILVRCELPCPRTSSSRPCGHSFPRHACHRGECPACRETCGRGLPACKHRCSQPCHQAVLVRAKQQPQDRPSGPWDPNFGRGAEIRALPCPPCREPLRVPCRGQHEALALECCDWTAHPEARSCGRPCGRLLTCGNHLCELECHSEEKSCDSCSLDCSAPRPPGCPHRCALSACHPGPCPPCPSLLKLRCRCSALAVFVPCGEWRALDEAARALRLTCPGQCPRPRPCGHLCGAPCHGGPCEAKAGPCVAKVSIRCRCGRDKRKVRCAERPDGRLECGERCEEARRKEAEEETAIPQAQEEDPTPNEAPVRRQRRRKRGAEVLESSGHKKLPVMTSLRRLLPAFLVAAVASLLAWAIFEARQL